MSVRADASAYYPPHWWLGRRVYIYDYELGISTGVLTEIEKILLSPHHTSGCIGMVNVDLTYGYGPGIIVHNVPPDYIEVRLRWLGARMMDGDEPSATDLYAPDIASMVIDRRAARKQFRFRLDGHGSDVSWIDLLQEHLFDWARMVATPSMPEIVRTTRKGGDDE